MTTKNIEYSKTVFLPKTSFTMKGGLSKKEPQIMDFWNKIKIYEKMLELRKNSRRYLLHDGPPYANGHIHIGHALNKILKDIVIKSQSMMGHYAPYVPGWDCHGLPIEQQLLKELKMGKKHINDIAAFRKKARVFASKFIDIQREEFKRLGVFGDWDKPYVTMSEKYEGTVIKVFNELLRKDYVFKGKKTISWCATCETALASAEVEYKDKTSPSIYVKFKILPSATPGVEGVKENLPQTQFSKQVEGENVYIVIWTTTPWTLPANMAAAVSNKEKYRLIRTESGILIVADKLADTFMREAEIKGENAGLIKGENLVGLKYEHCLAPSMPKERNSIRPVISTDFVEMETGTGMVHIAPGHGEDDFYAGKKWNLEIFCPVNNSGYFTKDAGIFEGMKAFDSNEKIIETLKESGHLLSSKSISHSYPHCWRCKKPIIYRATEQWFLGIDRKNLRQALVGEAEKVSWVPSTGKDRMMGMLKQRPDWCLSRQRYWGTPVPVLYCKSCEKVQIDEALMKHIEDRAFKEGSDFWFSESVSDIIPSGYKCSCGKVEFEKEKDILDVWLDSGVSWLAVVKEGELGESMYPVDLYLEGSDQHRGWFQTSLIPSVALEGKAPYKEVLTHGFVLDDKGKAMHKSSGNVVSPQEVYKKYGAEILRLWVALSDYSEDIRISDKLLSGPIDMYRKIRNTVRYLLGNLNDFNPRENYVSDNADVSEMDRYIRHRLALAVKDISGHYQKHEYRQAARRIADFCILDLSAFYLDALKDKLYTLSADDIQRRSAQTVLYDILRVLLPSMAPILAFTAEEAWQIAKEEIDPGFSESVFLSDLPIEKEQWVDDKLGERWAKIMVVREDVLKAIEDIRKDGKVGSSLEAKVMFRSSDAEMVDFLKSAEDIWPAIAIISECEVKFDKSASKLDISAVQSGGIKCPRCWQWRRDIGSDKEFSEICGRCANVMKKTEIK